MSVSVRSVLVSPPGGPGPAGGGPGPAGGGPGPAGGGPGRLPRGPYTYASTPRALYNNATLRTHACGAGEAGLPGQGQGQGGHANLMHDKRVVRGSTYAAQHTLHAAGEGGARVRRRARARRAPGPAAAVRLRPGTPPPAPGRAHRPLQTERHLEELLARAPDCSRAAQTERAPDAPHSPRYVPATTGRHAATQIYPGDLFDFDVEVCPVVEALVGAACEAALGETAREEERAALGEARRRHEELCAASRAERERLARGEARRRGEAARRAGEARLASEAAGEARARAAAAVLVQGYVAELLPAVLQGLRAQGYLVERVQRGVDEEFVPWLAEQVAQEIEAIVTSRDVITEIVRDVVEARGELYRAADAGPGGGGGPGGGPGGEEPSEPSTPPSVAAEQEEEQGL